MVETKSAAGVDFDWQQSSLFRCCDLLDWEHFLAVATVCEKTAGSVLWKEEEISELLVCVLTGSLEAVKRTPDWGKPIIMAQFLPGASVGELIFVDAVENHSTTLQVVENSKLLMLERSNAEILQRKYPETAVKLLRGAALLQLQRMRQVNQRMVALF